MKIKGQLLTTLILIVVALAIIILKFKPDILSRKNPNYFSSDFNKFCINNVCVDKENDGWMVVQDDHKVPADQEMVDVYIQKFKDVMFGDLISQNPNKFNELGIGGTSKFIIEINNKRLEIGNIASDTKGTYVREDGSQSVYKINTILEKNNLSNADYWYLRNLTKIEKSQIKKIKISWNKKEKEYVPDKKGQWENEAMVDKLSNLVRTKYLPDYKAENNSSYIFEIETENGLVKLNVNKSGVSVDGKYFFEISGSDFDLLTGKLG